MTASNKIIEAWDEFKRAYPATYGFFKALLVVFILGGLLLYKASMLHSVLTAMWIYMFLLAYMLAVMCAFHEGQHRSKLIILSVGCFMLFVSLVLILHM